MNDSTVRCYGRRSALVSLMALALSAPVLAADGEHTGKFEPALAADRVSRPEEVVFTPAGTALPLKLAGPIEQGAYVTTGLLFDARAGKPGIRAVLVEVPQELPQLLVDVNGDGAVSESEAFELSKGAKGYSNVFETVVELPLAGGFFKSFPLHVAFMRNVRWGDMKETERLLLESRTAFARGTVDIAGRKTLVQYGYDAQAKKVRTVTGPLGVDSDGNGEIDPNPFSPESAEANEEAVIFRVGDLYVSTKKADVEKNLITMRSHPASAYKRIELKVGGEMPDFEFTDFAGKKRRFSEFKGKYVLVDFWGSWCPPCRAEMPHLREAHERFSAKGFEILGMNTDQPEMQVKVKDALEKFGASWPQARIESIRDIIERLRIKSYPTTILVGPDGKVVSLNNTELNEPSLRGKELLTSLGGLIGK